MPRRATTFVVDHYYHLYNRGNNRQSIFFEPENFYYFLDGIKKYLLPVMDVLAYSLMPTHYHLLGRPKQLKTSEVAQISEASQTSEVSQTSETSQTSEVSIGVSRAMMRLSVSYTKAINKRFDRVGALFQGAFQAKHIDNEYHLKNLCIYIHANPVKDGLIADPEDWPYSNYPEWLDERESVLVDREFVRQYFGDAAAYQKLVMEYLKTKILPEDVRLHLQSLQK
ncbi:MAG: transposase [Chloroflexota bacterium]|nr:MAG: transposase [Chloroflexota bacterium]